MTTGKRELPQHPHLEYLRKEAKQRAALLRQRAASARLADAQHWLAREYGFSSWRALKDEVLRRMGMVRMAPLHHARRFQRPSLTVDEELEADGFFQRGAAVMGIGVIAALVIAALAILLAGHAFGQPADAAQKRAEQALPRTAIAMEPVLFDKYVGFYQLGPKAVIAVARDGEHFFIRAGSQPAAEIFPESQTKFFLKIVPAQISFTLDAQGKVTGAVLHQGGREMSLPRIDQAQAAAIAALPKGHPMARTWPVMADVVPRFLTSSSGGPLDYWPCFSPDGKAVLFSRTTDNGKTWALWRIAASGGAAEAFAKSPLPVSATRADWSARSDLIAFTGTAADRSNGIWVIKSDGTGAHALTAAGLSDQLFYPSWYPDGKELAVMDGSAQAIKRLGQGGAATAVTNRAEVLTGMPSVSPDGKWIAFAGQTNKGQNYDQEENVIWLADEHGALSTLETKPIQGRAPVWSPDGERLAFESDRGNPDGHYAVFIINRDGRGLAQVTDYALDATHPVFSRDGRHLVFAYGAPTAKANGIAILDLP